jgi:hypothetical protein
MQKAKYSTNSTPIRSEEEALSFAVLLAGLDRTQEALALALQEATDAVLDREVVNDRGAKRAIEHLQGWHWHETYHLGQLELLRAFIDSQA